jgi:hypothetical protein
VREVFDVSTTSRVATAVAAGYAFGRFKKLRMAVLVGSMLSSDKVRNAASGYIGQKIPGGVVGRTLASQAGGRLIEAGKTAASSAAASSVGSLSDRLAARTDRLRGSSSEDEDDDYDEEDAEDSEDSGDADDQLEGDEEEDEDADEAEDDDEMSDEADDEADEDEDVDEADEDEAEDEDEEEPVARSPRRRRSASPARS